MLVIHITYFLRFCPVSSRIEEKEVLIYVHESHSLILVSSAPFEGTHPICSTSFCAICAIYILFQFLLKEATSKSLISSTT